MKKLKITLAILTSASVVGFISWTNVHNESLSTDISSPVSSHMEVPLQAVISLRK